MEVGFPKGGFTRLGNTSRKLHTVGGSVTFLINSLSDRPKEYKTSLLSCCHHFTLQPTTSTEGSTMATTQQVNIKDILRQLEDTELKELEQIDRKDLVEKFSHAVSAPNRSEGRSREDPPPTVQPPHHGPQDSPDPSMTHPLMTCDGPHDPELGEKELLVGAHEDPPTHGPTVHHGPQDGPDPSMTEPLMMMIYGPHDPELGVEKKLPVGAHEAPAKHFIDQNRTFLIEKVANVKSILDVLLEKDAITKEGYENVRSKDTNQEKMRELYTFLNSRKAKDIFYKALNKYERFLLKELTHPPKGPKGETASVSESGSSQTPEDEPPEYTSISSCWRMRCCAETPLSQRTKRCFMGWGLFFGLVTFGFSLYFAVAVSIGYIYGNYNYLIHFIPLSAVTCCSGIIAGIVSFKHSWSCKGRSLLTAGIMFLVTSGFLLVPVIYLLYIDNSPRPQPLDLWQLLWLFVLIPLTAGVLYICAYRLAHAHAKRLEGDSHHKHEDMGFH